VPSGKRKKKEERRDRREDLREPSFSKETGRKGAQRRRERDPFSVPRGGISVVPPGLEIKWSREATASREVSFGKEGEKRGTVQGIERKCGGQPEIHMNETTTPLAKGRERDGNGRGEKSVGVKTAARPGTRGWEIEYFWEGVFNEGVTRGKGRGGGKLLQRPDV